MEAKVRSREPAARKEGADGGTLGATHDKSFEIFFESRVTNCWVFETRRKVIPNPTTSVGEGTFCENGAGIRIPEVTSSVG